MKYTVQGQILAALFLTAAHAGNASSEVVRDWTVSCVGDARCTLVQTSVKDDDSFLALARLQPEAEGHARLEIAVPEGVHLASGMFVATGQPLPKELTWVRCRDGLCLGVADLSAEELAIWRRAYTAALRYRPAQGGEVIEVPISLMGLSAALRRASELNAGTQ